VSHYDPPKEVVEYWCDECGYKRWRKPYKSHMDYGKRCEGTVIKATYVLAKKEKI